MRAPTRKHTHTHRYLTGGCGLGRLVALFGALDALATHLRSVLVPYYK